MTFERIRRVPEPVEPPGGERGLFRVVLASVIVMVMAIGWLALRIQIAGSGPGSSDSVSEEIASALDPATEAPGAATEARGPEPSPIPTRAAAAGAVFYTASNAGKSTLMGTFPGAQQAVELLGGAFDVRDPAVSPDGGLIAYASNQIGSWDIYLLNIATLESRALIRTPAYDGNPSWSPDGNWIAYESYADGDLDIWILPVDGRQAPLQLTNHPGMDVEPHWDPAGGRRIVFVSDREGSRDVYLADLDRPGERFANLTSSPTVDELDPAFDPTGSLVAYSSRANGLDLIWIADLNDPLAVPRQVGSGMGPVWSPDGGSLLAVLRAPYEASVVTYHLSGDPLPTAAIRSQDGGMDLAWAQTGIPWSGASTQGSVLAFQRLDLSADAPSVVAAGSMDLVELPRVTAPNPLLVEPAAQAFEQLRAYVMEKAGWDVLAELEHAFVGVNDPLPPGFAYNDWLYTGRAFMLPADLLDNGTMQAVREDFAGQTFWRVFIRTVPQSGELGQPMEWRPWDFEARYQGDNVDYQGGGRAADSLPGGYYIDFTAIAEQFGFHRQPALSNWRTFYQGARFGEFAFTDGLDWAAAMQQLYPASAIATPTAFSTPTSTPTRTPWPTPTPWWWYWTTPTPSQAAPTGTSPPAVP